MKLGLLFITLMLLFTSAFAQEKKSKYAIKAEQLQKQIWGDLIPEFKATTVPANMDNESAIILARNYSSQRTSNGKFKFLGIAGEATHTERLSTLHERVKINDKVSLDFFSKLEYQKKLDLTTSGLLLNKATNTHNTYVGVKVIKPDGTESIVNTGEEVLVQDDKKEQKGILAIPGLQVGDIVDYYISNEEVTENNEGNAFRDNEDIVVLADEYPIVYFGIDFQFNKKVNVRYIYANGAPHFEESHNEAGDLLLNVKVRNLARYESKLWTSPLRQFPYIEIGSSYSNKYNETQLGEKKLSSNASLLEGNKLLFASLFGELPDYNAAEKRLKEHFQSKTPLKEAPLDSVMRVLYDEMKYLTFCTYQGNEVEKINLINYRKAKNKPLAVNMALMLYEMGVNFDVLLVAPRTGNTLENVYGLDDFTACIRINDGVPLYMFFDDVMTHFNEIPARFQGEKAIVMHPTKLLDSKYAFTYSEGVLPVVPSDKNKIDAYLQVSFLPSDIQKLRVSRFVQETGSMRLEDQKLLIPVEDVDNGLSDLVDGEALDIRLKKQNYTKKMGDDFAFAFEQEREELSKNFTHEINGEFDQEPEQVTDCKIVNTGIDSSNPVFQFSSSFVLNNLVKKAGTNYIVDVGKLSSAFITLDKKDQSRTIDVYMPEARSFTYTISIIIPPGYSAMGMDEMTMSKANASGSFASVAKLNGNTLTISVARVYTHNFEKAADWPLLKELIETASTFNDLKILLEKKG